MHSHRRLASRRSRAPHTRLVAVAPEKGRSVALDMRLEMAKRVSVRTLDLDDFGAEDHGAEGTGDEVREVDNADSKQPGGTRPVSNVPG